jgi:hypothetical protein
MTTEFSASLAGGMNHHDQIFTLHKIIDSLAEPNAILRIENYVGVRTGVRIASKTHPQGGIDGPAQLVGRAETVPVWDVRQLPLLRFLPPGRPKFAEVSLVTCA